MVCGEQKSGDRRTVLWRAFALSLSVLVAIFAMPLSAAPGDADRGEAIYFGRCLGCHGEDGDGLGPAAERLNPPPRDFTLGQYKIKTTGFDDLVPNDADLFRMIRDGMPGTAMPGWDNLLSEQDMWDLIAYIKIFAGLDEEEPSRQVDYGTQVATSAESIGRGRELFLEGDRCSECHGQEGRGDAIKKLKDDNGDRTWPRNLTKPWTFRASNDPMDIFTRISVGIPGTQMPSFADPIGKKSLGVEDRWHIANYVASLAKTQEVVRPENTVVKAEKAEGGVPDKIDDPRWVDAEPVTFFLVPQIIAEDRLFTPSNDTITVRALYDEGRITFLLEWDDRTRSIPGDAQAESIAEPDMSEDAVALQLPVEIPDGMERPYFAMGDAANPVNLWQWRSGTAEVAERVTLLNGRGFDDITLREASDVGLTATGNYRDGTWRVLMSRPLTTGVTGLDLRFEEGAYIPIAISAWDGSNGESGTRHTLTTWYWLLLKSPMGAQPIVTGLVVFFLILGGEILWARRASPRKLDDGV